MAYHIDDNGKSAICTAKPGNCPKGGQHFETKALADKFIDELNEGEHGILPRVNAKTLKEVKFDTNIQFAIAHAEENYQEFEHTHQLPSGLHLDKEPNKLTSDYFAATIKAKEDGVPFNKRDHDYEWEEELDYSEENYGQEFEGGQIVRLTDLSEEVYTDDENAVAGLNETFQDNKESIDDYVKYVEGLDWKGTGYSKKDGEVAALKSIFIDSGLYE